MAIVLIMLFVILNMWIAFPLSYGKGAVQNGRYLLGITLPRKYWTEPPVQEVLEDYWRRLKKLHLAGLAFGLGNLIFYQYISLMLPYLILWFFLMIRLYNENLDRSARALYQVKCRNGWLEGDPHLIRIDTALSAVGEKGCVSFLWLVPAWGLTALGCLLLLRGGAAGQEALGMGVQEVARLGEVAGREAAGLGGMRVVWICSQVFAELFLCGSYLGIRRMRPQVYCSHTLANQKLNQVVKRQWSRAVVLLSYGTAILFLFWVWQTGRKAAMPLEDFQENGQSLSLLIFLGVCATGTLLLLLGTYHGIKSAKERVFQSLEAEQEKLYADEDEYWLNGYPAGRKAPLFAEKRVGIGLTISSGAGGGLAEKMVCFFIIAVVLGMSLFLGTFDFARITMEIEDGKCRIRAASMGYSFALDEVEEITWVESRPRMSKISGLDSNRFYLGDFRVKEDGKCKVYISLEQEAAIRVKTAERIIWFNSESLEETREFYEKLLDYQ